MRRFSSLFQAALGGLFALATAASAQPPDSLWSRTYGGSEPDYCNVVQQTTDGGYFLVGVMESPGINQNQFMLLKTGENGDSLWYQLYGGVRYENCFTAQQTLDGGYVLGGVTTSFPVVNEAAWLVKTFGDGTVEWSRSYEQGIGTRCYSMQQVTDGGHILAGYVLTGGPTDMDFWLLRVGESGDSLWSRRFGGTSGEWCYSVRQTSDGGYILGGVVGPVDTLVDMWLVKTDSNGDSLWSRAYGGLEGEICRVVRQTSDGGYVLAGCTSSFGNGVPYRTNMWLLKVDQNGDSLWSRIFGGDDDDDCYALEQTPDGGYILGGYTYASPGALVDPVAMCVPLYV
jgi:hypothetical protein